MSKKHSSPFYPALPLTFWWFLALSLPLQAADFPESPMTTLVSTGSVWKYYDAGTFTNAAWAEVSFDDDDWASGRAQLGYSEGDEATVISYGPDPNNKRITTYFRRAFDLDQPRSIKRLTLRLLGDDGSRVFINGFELARVNILDGHVTAATTATREVEGGQEGLYVQRGLYSGYLSNHNVLAVELHQNDRTDTRMSDCISDRRS